MTFEHAPDDPPPEETFLDFWSGFFNRTAENVIRIARYWGFVP
jgi:hypothetical protein